MNPIGKFFVGSFLSMVIAGLLSALFWCGCAPGMDGARQALSNAADLQTAAAKRLGEFDEKHQRDLLSEPDARTKILAYRAKRDEVVKLLNKTGAATQVGYTTIALVEAGTKNKREVDKILGEVVALVGQVANLLAEFGIVLGRSGP